MADFDAQGFIRENPAAVLATRRADGRIQTSPIVGAIDDDGLIAISTRETAAKTRNLRRDPWATLTFLNPQFYGSWLHVEGPAEVISLPDAMEPLVTYYRSLSGEHPDWDEYRQSMTDQKRVILRVKIEGAVGTLG